MTSHTFDNENWLKAKLMRLGITYGQVKYGQLHFSFRIGGKQIVYCYIRKNACSAFKKLIVSVSPFAEHAEDYENRIYFLDRYHKVESLKDFSAAEHTVFVYRDPFERIVSLYRNKFIQEIGAEAIIQNFRQVTRSDPEGLTFKEFVYRYLSAGFSKVDNHALPQRQHLWPATYSDAIPMNKLVDCMAEIIGRGAAKQYFGVPVNKTPTTRLSRNDLADVPLKELRHLYRNGEGLPSTEALIDEEVRDRLIDLYAEDLIFRNVV